MTDSRIAETIIEPESEGLRLDFYLQKRFSYRSRTEWQRSIEDGEILLNGRPGKASRKLHAGEKVAFVPKEIVEPAVDFSYRVLAETPDYLAVSKSGNLPCHPAGIFFKHTLWHILKQKYGTLHIATRLDRETSGIVLLARNVETARIFTKELEKGDRIVKKYLALVHGDFPEQTLSADGYLSPDPESSIRKKRRFTREPVPDSESCSTLFHLRARGNGLSLVEAIPKTGRLHQIRATLCSLGFPMVGDKLYGLDDTLFSRFVEERLSDADRAMLMISRQALHACSLELPFRDGILHFESELPDGIASLL